MTIRIISKSRQLLWLTLFLNVAAAGILCFLFFQVKGAGERTSTLMNEVDLQAKQQDTYRALKSLTLETAPERDKLKAYFIPKDGIASLIDLIEAAGRDVGVSVAVDSVEETPLENSDTLSSVSLKLHAKGSWENTVRFLGVLELLPYEVTEGGTVIERDTAGSGWELDAAVQVLKEK